LTPSAVTSLTRVIERLESELAAVKVEAVQVAALAAELDATKVRLEGLRQDRDRGAVQAHALAHPPAPHTQGSRMTLGLAVD
jgi:hypothetical protein